MGQLNLFPEKEKDIEGYPSERHARAINHAYDREVYKFGFCPRCEAEIADKRAIQLCDGCYIHLKHLGRSGKKD